jgi:sec-independent protein translocase protein TatC
MSDATAPNPEEQPLLAHLVELRMRVVRALIGIVVALIPLMFYARHLYHYLAEPMLKLMPPGATMIATEVASPFLAPFKLAAVVAFVIALPWVLFQLWAFVAPGLYKNERRLVVPLLASSTLLFYAGVAFAYFLVLPTIFHFFVSVAPEGVAIMTDVSKYLDFVLKIFVVFGVAFETPVAIVLLVLTGFVTPKQLSARRDYVLVGVFVIAAVLAPPDVLSQTLLAVPSYLLYEVGILASRWVVRNRPTGQTNEESQPEPPA